jgi:hypothetical protein
MFNNIPIKSSNLNFLMNIENSSSIGLKSHTRYLEGNTSNYNLFNMNPTV